MSRKTTAVTGGQTGSIDQYNNLRDEAEASSRLLARAQASPNMTLYVSEGAVYFGSNRVDFAGGNSPSFVAPVSNPRIDCLSINSSGVLVITQGAEGASPAEPAVPTGNLAICFVYNRVGETSIKETSDSVNGYIYKDIREFILKVTYVSVSSGSGDAGKLVSLGSDGKIDKSMNNLPDVLFQTSKPVNGSLPRVYTDDRNVIPSYNGTTIVLSRPNAPAQTRAVTSDMPTVDDISSMIKLGAYLYVFCNDTGTPYNKRVYRYDYTNLSAGGTLMTFAGAKTLQNANYAIQMTSDGTNFYFNFDAGNSGTGYKLAKYSLFGTTLTYVSSITVGTDADVTNGAYHVLPSGNIFAVSAGTIKKYNSSGSLQYTDSGNQNYFSWGAYTIENKIYARSSSDLLGFLQKLDYSD